MFIAARCKKRIYTALIYYTNHGGGSRYKHETHTTLTAQYTIGKSKQIFISTVLQTPADRYTV